MFQELACQKCVSVMQIGWERESKKKKRDGEREREESNTEGCIARMAGGVRKGLESQL